MQILSFVYGSGKSIAFIMSKPVAQSLFNNKIELSAAWVDQKWF